LNNGFGSSAVVLGAEVGAEVGKRGNCGGISPGIDAFLLAGGESVMSILSSKSCGTAVAGTTGGGATSFFGASADAAVVDDGNLNPDPKTGATAGTVVDAVAGSLTVPFVAGGIDGAGAAEPNSEFSGASDGDKAPNIGFDFSVSDLLNAPPKGPRPPNIGAVSFFGSAGALVLNTGSVGASFFASAVTFPNNEGAVDSVLG